MKTNNAITIYEEKIIEIMIDSKCTLLEAIHIDFDTNGVDKRSVLSIVDYLEERLYDLDKVSWFMEVYTGKERDMKLDRLE